MNEEDLKAIIAMYQQKSFELFNQNIVLEAQVASLREFIAELQKSKSESEDY